MTHNIKMVNCSHFASSTVNAVEVGQASVLAKVPSGKHSNRISMVLSILHNRGDSVHLQLSMIIQVPCLQGLQEPPRHLQCVFLQQNIKHGLIIKMSLAQGKCNYKSNRVTGMIGDIEMHCIGV